jgi:hypothetical protein
VGIERSLFMEIKTFADRFNLARLEYGIGKRNRNGGMKNGFERNHCGDRNDNETRNDITELFAISVSCTFPVHIEVTPH